MTARTMVEWFGLPADLVWSTIPPSAEEMRPPSPRQDLWTLRFPKKPRPRPVRRRVAPRGRPSPVQMPARRKAVKR